MKSDPASSANEQRLKWENHVFPTERRVKRVEQKEYEITFLNNKGG